MVITAAASYTKPMTLMTTYDDAAIERLIDRAADRVEKRMDKRFAVAEKRLDKKLADSAVTTQKSINEAIERTVGFYHEEMEHDIGLVLEATGFIKTRLDDMVTRDKFNDLFTEVKTIRRVVTDTNKDLRGHDRRITTLEKTIIHD